MEQVSSCRRTMRSGRHNAGGNDQRKGLFHGHADFNQFVTGDHDKTPVVGVSARGNNPDTGGLLSDASLDLAVGRIGDESDTVTPRRGYSTRTTFLKLCALSMKDCRRSF